MAYIYTLWVAIRGFVILKKKIDIWTNGQDFQTQITHDDMGWGSASYGSYSKVMVRSLQGHSKVKSAENVENNLFLLFLL